MKSKVVGPNYPPTTHPPAARPLATCLLAMSPNRHSNPETGGSTLRDTNVDFEVAGFSKTKNDVRSETLPGRRLGRRYGLISGRCGTMCSKCIPQQALCVCEHVEF